MPLGAAVHAVVEALEERRLLAAETFPITWDQWEHLSPTFFAQLAVSEREYPVFAQELNAQLAQLQAQSQGTSGTSAALAPALAFTAPKLSGRKHHAAAAHQTAKRHPKQHRHKAPRVTTRKPHLARPRSGLGTGARLLHPFVSQNPTVLSNNYVYAPGLPHQLTFTFSEDVSGTLSTSALVVINLKTAASVTPATYSYNSATNIATFGFGTTSWLADGNYAVVLKGSLIADASGNKLLGSDGVAGHDYVATSTSDNGLFWFLDADPNRDRSAGQDDLNIISAHYNTAGGYPQGDLNYDGQVNFTDLVRYAGSSGETVPLLGSPGTPTQTAAGTDRILISWPASSDSTVTNYDVYRNWQRVATGVPGTSYLDTGLATNTSYTYAIVAKDGSGNTSFVTVPLVANTAATGALTVQPVTNQTMDATGNLTFSTTFNDTGPAATHTASLTWGDGSSGPGTVTESNNRGTISGSHAYAGAGPYYAIVTVQGTNGESATTILPVAAFYDSDSGYTVGQTFTLSPVFIDPGGNTAAVQQYTVSWGDGSATETDPGTATGFMHVYASEASNGYTATVTATGSDGTYTDMPVINEAAPTLSLSGAGSATEGGTYYLTASVADGDTGESYTWEIDWGDGSDMQTLTAPAGTFSYAYSEAGTYTISAIASDNDDSADAGDIATAVAVINEVTPALSFSPDTGSVPESTDLTFTDTFSDGGGDSLDGLTVDWGDGNTDAYNGDPGTTSHAYAEAGTYSAAAIFATEDGLYTATATISATEVTPSFSIGVSAASSTEGVPYTFSANFDDPGSGDTPTNYTIVWGDGHSDSIGSNPDYQGLYTHTYTEASPAGGYSVTATATTDDGAYTATTTASVGYAGAAATLSGLGGAVSGQPYALAAFFKDPGGDQPTYTVDWNDGTTLSYGSPTFSHAYSSNFNGQGMAPTVTVSTDDSPAVDVENYSLEVDEPGGAGNISSSSGTSAVEGAAYNLLAYFSDSAQGSYGFPDGAWWTIC